MNESVIELPELLTLAKENNVRLFEASAGFDNFYGRGIQLQSIKDFFELTVILSVKVVYYFNDYADKTGYLLPFSDDSSLSDEITKIINNNISMYNQDLLEKIDFSQAINQSIYFLNEGHIHYIDLENSIFSDIPEVDEKYDEICNDIIDRFGGKDLEEFQRKQKENLAEKIKYIQDEILNNKQFHISTNGELRLKFGRDFFEEHPDYPQIIKQAGYPKLSTFLDETWKLYKNRKNK